MNRIDMKAIVAQTIKSEWPAFEREHPRLAAVLDQSLLIEQATTSLAEDAEYQSAMSCASAMGVAADTLHEMAARFVKDWINKLF